MEEKTEAHEEYLAAAAAFPNLGGNCGGSSGVGGGGGSHAATADAVPPKNY